MDPSAVVSRSPVQRGAPGELKIVPGRGAETVQPPRPAPAPPTHGRRSRRWLIAAIVLAVAAIAGVQVWRASQAAPVMQYVTAPIARGSITRAVTATGSVNPVTTIQVGTYVSGVIRELYCDFNTQVRKGQLCAKIDPSPYQSVVEQNRATLATSRAQLTKDQRNLEYAKLTYERNSELLRRGIVPQDTADAARSAFSQAEAQVELDQASIQQHEAALHAAEINLAYTDIVSPVNGTVVTRNVTMGQTVAASFQTPTLFLIATDLTKMQVDANVSESDIGGISIGNDATFTVEAFPRRVFTGTVTQVRQAPQTVQNVVTYDVVISVPNPDRVLKPGMTATVRVTVAKRDDVLRIPNQALRYTPSALANQRARRDEARVWVLRDGRPTAVPVTVGLDDDTSTEVTSGELKAGDQVLISEKQVSGGAAGGSARPPSLRL